jgi:hypothetical protein
MAGAWACWDDETNSRSFGTAEQGVRLASGPGEKAPVSRNDWIFGPGSGSEALPITVWNKRWNRFLVIGCRNSAV